MGHNFSDLVIHKAYNYNVLYYASLANVIVGETLV